MIRERRAAKVLKIEAPRTYRALQQACRKGLPFEREFDYLLERLMLAEVNKDGMYPLFLVIALQEMQPDFGAILEKSTGSAGRKTEYHRSPR
jgi:hypothetical protein